MSIRQGAHDTAVGAYVVLIGAIAIVALVVAGVATWAGVAPWVTNKQREINHNSQQYQDGKVQELRDLVVGITSATDSGQIKVLTDQFCAEYNDLKDQPADLASFQSKHC